MGETAYQVQEGFIGEILLAAADIPTTPAPGLSSSLQAVAPAPGPAAAGNPPSSDTDLLTKFLLDNLNS
jgi:hypothetical protein